MSNGNAGNEEATAESEEGGDAVDEITDAWVPSNPDDVIPTLLRSIRGQNLTVFCGAGLSMGDPSSVPSADDLVEQLEEEHLRDTGRSITDEISDDIEEIADWALRNTTFRNFFLDAVRDPSFFNPPNAGHSAVADFLLTKAIQSALSTNVDYLIEKAVERLGRHDFEAVVKEYDVNRAREYSDLLKLHGCFRIDKENTVWCSRQLTMEPICDRIGAFKDWMRGNLRGNDLLLIGYWTDWPYLNETFADCIRDLRPPSVVLVNPDEPENLREKAEGLWDWVIESDTDFHHVPLGGNDFLERLRFEFSKRIFRILAARVCGNDLVEAYYGESVQDEHLPPFEDMDMEALYNLRRDFAGVAPDEPATDREPVGPGYNRIGAMHQFLLAKGASMDGRFYKVGGSVLRLINGQGEPFGHAVARLLGKPQGRGYDANVCVSSPKGGMAKLKNVVRDYDEEDEVVRLQNTQEWWTEDRLRGQVD